MSEGKWQVAARQGTGAKKAQGAIEPRAATNLSPQRQAARTNCCSSRTARTLHGQGATEYLILLAVVLVIAIVVVALLGFFPGTATDARMAQSKAYWDGVASPLQITDTQPLFTGTSNIICGQASKRGTRMAIMNTYTSQITITTLSVGNTSTTTTSVQFCPGSGGAVAPSITVDPGGSALVDVITGTDYCGGANGSLGEYYVRFTYSTPYLAGQTQLGSKPLSFRC